LSWASQMIRTLSGWAIKTSSMPLMELRGCLKNAQAAILASMRLVIER